MQDTGVWRFAIITLSIFGTLLTFVAMQAIKNRDNPTYYSMTSNAGKTDMFEFFRLIKRSKPMRSLIIAAASDSLAASVRVALIIYLFANIIMNRGLSAAFDILNGVVFGIPVLLVGMYIATKKGSAVVYGKVSLVQTIIAASGFFLCLIFLPPDASYVYESLTVQVCIILVVFGLYMSSLGISTNLVNAMTGDLSDYEYVQTGKFIPGTIGATLTFVNKCAISVVGIITTAMMLFSGFSTDGSNSVVPENVFVNYRFYYCVLLSVFILPAAGHFITWVAMRKYPLTEEVMEEVSHKMQKEREEKEKAEAK